MKTSSKFYWLMCGAVQIVGFVSLAFGDPHVHVVLKNLGLLLLLPGTLAALVFAEIGVGIEISCLPLCLGGVLLANFKRRVCCEEESGSLLGRAFERKRGKRPRFCWGLSPFTEMCGLG